MQISQQSGMSSNYEMKQLTISNKCLPDEAVPGFSLTNMTSSTSLRGMHKEMFA